MKTVAISQRVDIIEQHGEKRDALDQRWWDLLSQCGITAVVIPNVLSAAQILLARQPWDGIILTGGNDTAERKEVENFLLDKAVAESIPVLGICHGMQRIQGYFGVALEKVAGHVMPQQDITIHDATQTVNSYHEFGTRQTTADLNVWAVAGDGVIKAIEHKTHPITGIMWHPERISPYALRDIAIIKNRFYGDNA